MEALGDEPADLAYRVGLCSGPRDGAGLPGQPLPGPGRRRPPSPRPPAALRSPAPPPTPRSGGRGRSFDHPAKLASNRVPKESAWVQVTLVCHIGFAGRAAGSCSWRRRAAICSLLSGVAANSRPAGWWPGEERLKWCAAWQQRAVRRPARRTRRWWRGPGGDQRSVQLGAAQDVQDPLGWAVQALTGASLTHPTATPSALRPPARRLRPDLARVRRPASAKAARRRTTAARPGPSTGQEPSGPPCLLTAR